MPWWEGTKLIEVEKGSNEKILFDSKVTEIFKNKISSDCPLTTEDINNI